MRRSTILILAILLFLMAACACVAGVFLLRNALPLPLRTETARVSDGSEIILPRHSLQRRHGLAAVFAPGGAGAVRDFP
jgi:hypothetical protein